MREIDRLLDDHTCDEKAAQLNARGWRSFEGKVFHAQRIVRLRRDYGLRDLYSRLRAAGLERTFAWLGRYRRVSSSALSAGFAPQVVPRPDARCSPVTPLLMCGSSEQHLLPLKGALLGPL